MKKEPLLAIIFGIGFGMLVAGLIIFRSRGNSSNNLAINDNRTGLYPAKNSTAVGQTLVIDSPADKQITDRAQIEIKGKASRGALIVVQSPLKDLVWNNKDERFTLTLPLAAGENIIHINSYPKDKTLNAQQKELKVYYLDEE